MLLDIRCYLSVISDEHIYLFFCYRSSHVLKNSYFCCHSTATICR